MTIIRVASGKIEQLTLGQARPPINTKHPKPLKGGLASSNNRIPALKPRQVIALDTETTGLDFWHGCRPFFVSMMWEDGNMKYWEWEKYIDPMTRVVSPPQNELDEIAELILENDFVLHNTKVDVRGLESLGLPRINLATVHDTLIGSHVLCSNEPHGLKEQAMLYLDIRDDDQKALQEATNKARVIARQMGWAIAQDAPDGEPNHPHFPATRHSPPEGWWVMDTWLLKAVAIKKKYLPNHPWWKLLRTYGLRDVERTYGLHMMQMHEFGKRENQGLMGCYKERLSNLEATYVMEHNGATINNGTIGKMDYGFAEEASDRKQVCLQILGKLPDKVTVNAKGHEKRTTVAPNLNSSHQIQWLLFTKLGLTPGKKTKTGFATDKDTLNKLLQRFDRLIAEGKKLTTNQLKAKQFITDLLGHRKREKSRDYLREYKLRGCPTYTFSPTAPPPKKILAATPVGQMTPKGFSLLHFWFNITGTNTTRLSSSQPNGQNIGKGEVRDAEGNLIEDFNLRKAFGPTPGREWYSIDYSNIELRLFAYESGDTNLIKAFETGYSVHLIFAEVVYPKQFNDCRIMAARELSKANKIQPASKVLHKDKAGNPVFPWPTEVMYSDQVTKLAGDIFKKLYESTYYQWCKNGNFALIYGAGVLKANTTYHVSGAYDLIRNKLPLIDELMARKDHEAKSYGYVTLRPGCDYRLWVPHDRPHVAVNYFVQGRAGWCMVRALNRVYRFLSALNKSLGYENSDPRAYRMIMTIHDELVFDFPIHQRNREVICKIKFLMEQSGRDLSVPTPVDVELHAHNWGEGDKIKDLQPIAVAL